MMSNTVALSIKLESSYKDRLSHLAVAKKRTSHALAREAIQRFVEQEETHENDRKEAIASYEEYLETGLHITLDEADEWMATWGNTNEKDMPVCHK
jgi:predicted transcriptional regulator